MIALFDDLHSAKVAYNLGNINYRCLACGRIHDSKEKIPDCREELKRNLCYNIVDASRLPATIKREIDIQIRHTIKSKYTKVLWKACDPESHWLMMKNKIPIVHEILNNRLTEEDKQLFKIRY